MNVDNASLKRRLAQVTTELNRIQSERDEMLRDLKQFENDNNRIDINIREKDETDMANQAMKDDLERNKAENEKM